MSTTATSKGIFDSANAETRDSVVELLTKAYWMEIETVMSYIAASVNLDGVRAQEIKESLAEDIKEELGHAQLFAERIKELYGVVPGLRRVHGRTGLPAAAGGADRHRPRDPRRDQGRAGRDRALHPDRRGDRPGRSRSPRTW